ncbi:hypothetical protein HB837_15495 [Listeria innocua]|uniref:hypothetical protein n=1 Tax=Listeria innocua TaxID=1642 RepID=UPI001627D489|nr:hypothetical protein [Listeria innocua]EBF5117163.1 hypothetical protein [Listeria monocytogenes]EBF5126040.1 hypothetical protein [Listeria monocytogenes]EHK4067842.1 hypothetical protein [Listeria monocytogenes]MBC1339648.1 hypothetical protein [Listeria innocua]MBC1353814.1 hypothetical protein [Listeria innocua]
MDSKNYELFKEGLSRGEEYLFTYHDIDYWISHGANGVSSLSKEDGTHCQDFDSLDELFKNAQLEGKSLNEARIEIDWGIAE